MSSPHYLSPESVALTRRTIRREIQLPAPAAPSARLCVFSHHDPDGVVDPHVLFYLSELARVAEIIFVTTCRELPERDVAAVARHCARIVFRENGGRDFGGYRVGLVQAGDLSGRQEVLLANDSVYGPLADLAGL